MGTSSATVMFWLQGTFLSGLSTPATETPTDIEGTVRPLAVLTPAKYIERRRRCHPFVLRVINCDMRYELHLSSEEIVVRLDQLRSHLRTYLAQGHPNASCTHRDKEADVPDGPAAGIYREECEEARDSMPELV